MRFESKRDMWLWIVAVAGPVIVVALLGAPPVAIVIAVGAALVLVWWTFRSTYYVIEDDTLTIRSMGLKWRVPIRDIRSITPSGSALSSPALSLDRLRIDYGSKSILVSPDNREQFIAMLRSVNPSIDHVRHKP